MKYLLDTCVLSELMKLAPNGNVVRWLSRLHPEDVFISVFTIAEIRRGLVRQQTEDRGEKQPLFDFDFQLRLSTKPTIQVGFNRKTKMNKLKLLILGALAVAGAWVAQADRIAYRDPVFDAKGVVTKWATKSAECTEINWGYNLASGGTIGSRSRKRSQTRTCGRRWNADPTLRRDARRLLGVGRAA